MDKTRVVAANAGIGAVTLVIASFIHIAIYISLTVHGKPVIGAIAFLALLSPLLFAYFVMIFRCLKKGEYKNPEYVNRCLSHYKKKYPQYVSGFILIAAPLFYFQPSIYNWPELYVAASLFGFGCIYIGSLPESESA